MNHFKKIGRKSAGTWGRPRRNWAKRMSSRAIRRLFAKTEDL